MDEHAPWPSNRIHHHAEAAEAVKGFLVQTRESPGQRVLVYCVKGANRSALLISVCMAVHSGTSVADAVARCKSVRGIVYVDPWLIQHGELVAREVRKSHPRPTLLLPVLAQDAFQLCAAQWITQVCAP